MAGGMRGRELEVVAGEEGNPPLALLGVALTQAILGSDQRLVVLQVVAVQVVAAQALILTPWPQKAWRRPSSPLIQQGLSGSLCPT